MKLIADPIFVPDNADWQTIEDAKSRANWDEVKTREELMKRTSLEGKCGSCKHYRQKDCMWSKAVGNCTIKGWHDNRARTTPACKEYERKE